MAREQGEPQKRKPRKHRRGEGSTYYDKAQERHVAQLSLGIDKRTGRRRLVRRTTKDEREVDALLAHLRHRYIGVGEVGLQTLDEYLEDWLAATKPTIAPRTYESYSGLIEHHVSPLLGGIMVAELRPVDVKRLIRECLDGGLSPTTVHRVVGVLRMALAQAVADGELTTNVAKVKLPKVERDRVTAMTPAMAEKILEAVDGHYLEAIITLLLGCGLRVGEACALDWRDVRLPEPGQSLTGHEAVTVRRGKTKAAQRDVPLPAFVAVSLMAHRARTPRYGPSEPVFLGVRGERIRRDHVSHAFPRLLEDQGLPKMRTHDLRHGTATLLVAKGVPLPVVADILGHSDPSITAAVYSHASTDSTRAAMAELDIIRPGG